MDSELLKFRKAIETSGEVIFLTDREGVITYINPEFTRVYGHSAEDVLEKTTPRILKSGAMSAQDYEGFWERLLNKGVFEGEFVNRCKDGSLVRIEGTASPILGDDGGIIGFLAIQRDITERVKAEERIRQRNKELTVLNTITSTVSQSLDLNQIVNDALDVVLQLDMFDKAAKGMLFRLDEERGELVLMAHRGAAKGHPCLTKPVPLGECLCGRSAQNGEVIISNGCLQDNRHQRRWDRMHKHSDICLPMKARGQLLGVMNVCLPVKRHISKHQVELLTAVAEQISLAMENASLFEAISQQHNRLRSLRSRLAEAEEIERRRLAQELHDQVGQKLTALGINLNIIQSELSGGSTDVNRHLKDSQLLVEQTAQLIRGVMTDLRPPMLDDLGLIETLHWYGDQFAKRSGIAVTVRSDKTRLALRPHIENALFRIVQEALTNVVKHARAGEVTITVEMIDKTVHLMVADDGVGYQPGQVVDSIQEPGWGTLIMAERAEAAGGRCWIETRPSKCGTRVLVEVPL